MNGFTYESELYCRDRNTDTEQYWGNTDTTNTVSIQLPSTNYDNDFSSPSTVLLFLDNVRSLKEFQHQGWR